MHTQITTNFRDRLNDEGRRALSLVIDDIEQETMWETRTDLLNFLDAQRDVGKLDEMLTYLINKTKPAR